MSDTLLHCFACDAFSPQTGDALECSVCSSDFVEIVQVERSPTGRAPASNTTGGSAQQTATPGLPGMLTNLLSSILPAGMMNTGDQSEDSQPTAHSTATAGQPADAPQEQAPELPPFNDWFSQMFGQFPQGRATANPPGGGTSYTRTTHGPGGSSFTFSFGSSSAGQPVFFSSMGTNTTTGSSSAEGAAQNPFPFGNVHDGIPQIQNFPDLASFLAQALGAVPGRAGDYASNETFDNIMSELMNRNPNSNVHAASDRAIEQIHRFKLQHLDAAATDLQSSKIGEECSICQEEYAPDETLVDLRCHHVFHEECLLSWVKTNGICPICRAPVQEMEETLEQDALD